MPLAPSRTIPTVAEVCERFVANRSNQKAAKELRSILLGSRRTVGRRAAGVPLANSVYGPLRFDRVEGHEFVQWLNERFGPLSADSFKRARSALRQLLLYAVEKGYAEKGVLADLPRAPGGQPRRTWLRPEQLAAFDALVVPGERLSDWVCFLWETLINEGLRIEEAVELEPTALNVMDRTLVVLGKGSGEGKRRPVPFTEQYGRSWAEYVLRNPVRRWMYPASQVRFAAGAHRQQERIVDWSEHMSQKSARTQLAVIKELAVEEARAGRFDPTLIPSFAITPHMLRRTFACTQLIAHALGLGGLDLRSLQIAMGHARLDTTAGYLADVDAYLNRHRRLVTSTQAASEIVARHAALAGAAAGIAA